MTFPDNIPTFRMSPPHFATNSDVIEVRPQFPMNNQHFDQPPSFKRARISDNNHPPRMMVQPPSNKGTSHIFFKTRICVKFKLGSCRNGENCNFAHGVEDIRKPPPNWQELVGSRNDEQLHALVAGNWDDDQKIIHKMKLCKKFYNGEECPYGDKCNFLHEDPAKFRDDSRNSRESTTISIGTNGSPKSYGDGTNNLDGNRAVNKQTKGTYWKTKLCLKWEHTGHCPFGDDCHFAHGLEELQAFGGRVEAEIAGAVANSTKAIIIPTSVSAIDAPPTTLIASQPVAKEEEQTKKHLLRLKVNKKINRIYGDWIDDLPLVLHNLPSTVET
ncbi:zinc finger CCCH domain-containing protein 39 isoform X2 [Cicer arietinum]|uniref:Zinc finger CCCH domain-containing protein 39 isoform X1 n=1 Tax=Cicer arietinum TaxID=3827 RepID=A0A1S2YQX3_CICAR|nr:zinc finger CCCH domain-containing protein 39 isoform X1 [Cicer arietinum]XP_004508523.1 zinc finger CCCH domain-containing protein 39 isoform X1 [Cicer arietinum]